MLDVHYAPGLVAASVAVAVMAAFTSLRLTSGLGSLPAHQRKIRLSQAAFTLGGGIWSMHFVGMMSVEVPVPMFYDPLRTMGSFLIAILLTGTALMSLHFGVRTRNRILLAGIITAIGIVSMHYLGMSAISGNCVVSYSVGGVLLAIGIAMASSTLAMELAYRRRTLFATVCGAIALGLSISAMHYSAMLFTTFSLADSIDVTATQAISSNTLALIVAIAAFVICGLFLLTAVPDEAARGAANDGPHPAQALEPDPAARPDAFAVFSKAFDRTPFGKDRPDDGTVRIPYEKDKTLRYVPAHKIRFVQANGHYTLIASGEDKFFCPWSITRVEQSLDPEGFIRTHRSYLVNKQFLTGLRRQGDKAVCIVGDDANTEIPVSRARIAEIQEMLRSQEARPHFVQESRIS